MTDLIAAREVVALRQEVHDLTGTVEGLEAECKRLRAERDWLRGAVSHIRDRAITAIAGTRAEGA